MSPERFLAIAVVLGLGACGGERDAPAGPERVKLVDVASGELVEREPGEPGPVVFSHDFASGIDGWREVTDAARPLAVANELLDVSIEDDGHLRLAGERGALYRVVEVEPLTTYAFTASVRARDLVPATEPFFGAAPWLAELTDFGPPEELFAAGIDPLVDVRHLFPTAHGTEGWQECRAAFRTGPRTRGLAVALLLGLSEDVSAGAVEFGPVQLCALTEAETWYRLLEKPLLEYAAAEPRLEGWRARRLVSAPLGAEWRPSIVCFPGDLLTLRVRVPSGTPVFEAGLGPWPAALMEGAGREQRFVVRVDGAEQAFEREAPRTLTEARWHEVSFDLRRHAGEEVTLELAVEGELPGVFGAPVLRDTGAAPDDWNLLLISIDTLRADHVGSYGYALDTTLRLDQLAREGLRFADVTAQAPYTLPSHASLFTGQFPSIHGVQEPPRMISARRSPSLARILSSRGYRTQAFTGGGFVNADFGFERGFDGFANVDPLRHREARFFQKQLEAERDATRRMGRDGVIPFRLTRERIEEYGPGRVLAWLRDHRDEPFFLFVHTYAVHDFDPPEEYRRCRADGCTSTLEEFAELRLTPETGWRPMEISEGDRRHLIHLYDEALRYTDHRVGELLDRLDELGLSERTVVVVTSDHGEEMFDRGFFQHGKTLYEELTSIPLLLRYPGVEPRVVAEPAMLVDVAPTVLGLLGIEPDPRMQGIDLLRSRPARRPIWSEIDDAFVRKYAYRDPDGWKLLYGSDDEGLLFPSPTEWELYHLAKDRAEQADLSASESERFERLREAFEKRRAALAALADSLGAVGLAELDEETLRQLKELGYVE